LVPIGVENGATEFIPGSHKMTCKESIMIDTNNRFQASIKEFDLGSIIVFDGRICHRGLRNLTDKNRTVLYMVWTKKWYVVV
jgi:ectoine hydroxylase-related dioxygenase (phytanoyl-CoA dioxygenase family)